MLSLTVTLFSEKMFISTRCIHGFVQDLIKKSDGEEDENNSEGSKGFEDMEEEEEEDEEANEAEAAA